jgi:hypothetical protein
LIGRRIEEKFGTGETFGKWFVVVINCMGIEVFANVVGVIASLLKPNR